MIRVVGGIVGRHNINIDNNLIQIKDILLEMTQSENTAILNAVQLFIENTYEVSKIVTKDKLNIITVTLQLPESILCIYQLLIICIKM